jgi:mRNA interferase RelE/StbE
MIYQVVVPKTVQKALDDLPRRIRLKIGERVMALSANPRPPGAIKLKGYADQYRIRVGRYRVRFTINDEKSIVVIISCKHRKDVYKD